MKRKFAKALTICLLLTVSMLALGACGGGDSGNEYVGTWNAVKISVAGYEFEPDEMGMEVTIDIESGGTIKVTTNGESDGEGEWKPTEDGIQITDGTGSELTGVKEDGHLVIDFGDEFILTMEKE